jgi:monooxygenase
METPHFDVLIIGAGISGISAAYYLQNRCPGKSYAILESRDAMGGTWDLFRYPGVRSDSDLYTFGFSFRPWTEDKSIADGQSILNYLCQTSREFCIDRHIRFGHRVMRADWHSSQARWLLDVRIGSESQRFTCTFLSMCTGYYDYDEGYLPRWPGTERFTGTLVHPQKWPPDLDYAGKRILVIGSGATAVTLVPAMAREATHVTMLQRTPTYIVAAPARDALARLLRRFLPERPAFALARWKNVLVGMAVFQLSRRAPNVMRQLIKRGVRSALGDSYDVQTHFSPPYNPWDQRLCLVPDGDLFKAIRSGKASIVTDRIECFTERGIKLVSGTEIEADIIVTATGLKIKLFGGSDLLVDGKAVDITKALLYKGMMLDGVPNLATASGYTNASWTLKCELTAGFVCRLLNHMDKTGVDWCMPVREPGLLEEPAIDFNSGYVLRALSALPKQGHRKPWRLNQNYPLDVLALGFGRIEDGALRFGAKA